MRDAAGGGFEERQAPCGWVIDDDQTLGHAAQFCDRLSPIGRMHEQTQTADDVEAPIAKVERVHVANLKPHRDALFARALACDRQHFLRRVDGCHQSAAARQ